jgi:DNA polymerase-3 subunit beta
VKFRCERDVLTEALSTAGRSVATRTGSAAAALGLRIEVEENHLVVLGTDLDLTMRVELEVTGLEDGAFVVPARLVTDIVRLLEPGAVTFEGGDDEVQIFAARSKFVVRTYSLDDFPVLTNPGLPQATLPTTMLAEALRQVVRAASDDDTRPLLTGVLIAAEGNGIRLVATDSYRLALRDVVDVGPLPSEAEQILLPARALSELQRLLGTSSTTDTVSGNVGFSMSELDATFSIAGVRLTTRLLDGHFPDYRQLIPAQYPSQLRVGKESLLDALRRVRLLVRDNTTPVRLSLRPSTVELSVVSQEIGHASEDVDADYEGDELVIAFNPTYLIDGVDAVVGDEVVLETVDATKPATVRAPEHDNYRYLLMPVRVS